MTRAVPADPERTRRAVTTAGQIGPYFIAGVGPCDGFVAAQDFYQPRRLHEVIRAVAQRIGTAEPHVAASSLQYELAERLWSMILACWQLDNLVVDLNAVTFQAAPNGRIRIRFREPAAVDYVDADPIQIAAHIARHVVGHLSAAHAGLHASTRVADGLLWGNAAAALALVARNLLSRKGDEGLALLATALLASPPLAGRLEGHIATTVMRRTCCLYYRTSARRTCGDCPLTGSVAARRRA